MKAPRLPKSIARDLERLPAQRVVVAAVMTIALEDSARLTALGMDILNGEVLDSAPVLLSRDHGPYALRNLDGWTVKRNDQPKGPRDISHWAPNWHGSGTHLVVRQVMAYPADYHPAKLLTISATVIEKLSGAVMVRLGSEGIQAQGERAARPRYWRDLRL